MNYLREIRKRRGLTMKQLGKLAGVTESMIGMIETGERNPSFETLLRLGEALDVPVDMIVRGNIYEPLDGSPDPVRYLDLFKLTESQQKAIRILLDANPQGVAAFVAFAENLKTGQPSQDDQ